MKNAIQGGARPAIHQAPSTPASPSGAGDGSIASNAPDAPLRVALSFEAHVFQCFVRGLRSFWREQAYRGTIDQAAQLGVDDPAELERRMRASPHYELYAWLERHSQQLKYYGRWGIVSLAEAQRDRFSKALEAAAARHPERLRLDPDLRIPAYVRDADTHQHRGGIWSDACDAFAYETSTSGYTFSLFDPRSPLAVYAQTASDALAAQRLAPKRIVDLGCTIGGSTRALKRVFPHAEVFGCDVCAPVLALAHLRSLEEDLAITWFQRSAEKPGFDTGGVDLVASHWLFHEMPPHAIRNCLREARRILRPGGVFMAYDMYLLPGGAIGRWLHAGYAARNNEPYAYSYAGMDMRRELELAGFGSVDIRIVHPEPDESVTTGALPAERTHYMTMITAAAPWEGDRGEGTREDSERELGAAPG